MCGASHPAMLSWLAVPSRLSRRRRGSPDSRPGRSAAESAATPGGRSPADLLLGRCSHCDDAEGSQLSKRVLALAHQQRRVKVPCGRVLCSAGRRRADNRVGDAWVVPIAGAGGLLRHRDDGDPQRIQGRRFA